MRLASKSRVRQLLREAHGHSNPQVIPAAQTERDSLTNFLQMSLGVTGKLDDSCTGLIDP